MNRFLTNINKILITVKHLSSKFQLNEIADHQSRNPAPCSAVNCSIHRFINGLTDTIVDAAAKCAPIHPIQEPKQPPPAAQQETAHHQLASQDLSNQITLDTSMTNRQAWKAAQNQSDACKAAISHLKSGKVPSSKPGDTNNETRHYVRHASLAPDGLLVTTGDQSTYAPGDPKTKIIIPHHLAAGVLYHLHNNVRFSEHPTQSRLKHTYNRHFYTWNLAPLLEDLYKNCYHCLITQK